MSVSPTSGTRDKITTFQVLPFAINFTGAQWKGCAIAGRYQECQLALRHSQSYLKIHVMSTVPGNSVTVSEWDNGHHYRGAFTPSPRSFRCLPSTTDYDTGKVTAGLTQPEVGARCSPRRWHCAIYYVFYELFEEFTNRTRVLVDCMNRNGHLRTVNTIERISEDENLCDGSSGLRTVFLISRSPLLIPENTGKPRLGAISNP